MPRTIIVGSGGRLGAALLREWTTAGVEIAGFTRAELDLADTAALQRVLDPLDFDVLVNCAAQTNVDRCETHPEEAFAINRDAVRTLAQICTAKSARFVHISTDYVFDGESREPYREEDPAEPISYYGQSKRDGEIALLDVDSRHLAVRVSWVFGPDRPSFVDQILQRALTSNKAEAIGDKWAVPTYTLDIARHLHPLLRHPEATGLLHLCNGGSTTWQEYGQYALDCAAAAGLPLQARTVVGLKLAELKAFIAKRPVYTVMATEKLTRLTGETPRSWQDAVAEYVTRECVPRLRV